MSFPRPADASILLAAALLCLPACYYGYGDGTPEPTATPSLVSDIPYCDPVRDWDPEWSALEDDVLTETNLRRAQGADCGSEGRFDPTDPLVMDPALRCAARLHSLDMSERNYFDHVNPDGEQPWDRVEQTDYGSFTVIGENISGGTRSAEGVVDGWMGSDGHCANIMLPSYEHIGVGYYAPAPYWTQVFASGGGSPP